ncbi:MAG: hypothetical protein EOO46_15865 [Flavobacterium sp.]|nr:MAG: hypothetical protein EOO46_15865 [Flavobacterium sp.]
MRKLQNLTVFFVLGVMLLLIGIPYSIFLINGNSAQDGLLGIYLLFGIVPVLFVLLVDRLLVRKFGSRSVNRVQLYFFGFVALLWVVRFVVNLFY